MHIHGMTIRQVFFLGLYYGIGYHLPRKTSKWGGIFSKVQIYVLQAYF